MGVRKERREAEESGPDYGAFTRMINVLRKKKKFKGIKETTLNGGRKVQRGTRTPRSSEV